MSHCYRLNPCDYLYFAHHTMLQRRGQTGSTVIMVLDLVGHIPPQRVQRAIDRVTKAHPVLAARARLSLAGNRPYWFAEDEVKAPQLIHHDCRGTSDWLSCANELTAERLGRRASVYERPLLAAELIWGPSNQARLCLAWPHALMDAEGGQWLIRELDRLSEESPAAAPAELSDDDEVIDPLEGEPWWRRMALFRRGWRGYQGHEGDWLDRLGAGTAAAGRWRILLRTWRGAAWDELCERAARWCPEGPARLSRYLGGCVLRAVHRLMAEGGIDSQTCLVTLPMRCRGMPARRPMCGNYLVSATLAGDANIVRDKRALMDELGRQITAFAARGGDRANWALLWLAGWLREWQYRWYLGSGRGMQPYASGFSFYVNGEPLMTSFLGARVVNSWGTGTMMAPPGWNPVFSRFGDQLTLALAWLEGYHRPETATRHLDLIEGDLFDRAG